MTAVAIGHRPAPARQTAAPRVVTLVWGALLTVLTAAPFIHSFVARRGYTAGPSPLGRASPAMTDAVTSLLANAVVAVAFGAFVLALPVARRQGRSGPLVLSTLALAGATIVSAWWHDAAIGIGVLALPLVVLAMASFPRPSAAWFEAKARLALRVLVWASVAAGALLPAWALQRGTLSVVLPGVTTRLAGVTPHPNALGPVAVALVVLEWRRRPRSLPALAIALLALTWTQSKTSWAGFALVAGVAGVTALRRRRTRGSRLPALALLGVFGMTAYLGLGLLGDTDRVDERDISTETFTGRTAIWQVTLEVWAEDPVLGYGPRLWDDDMDRRYASRVGFPPGHAHNQLVQTLGQSGLVGAAALLAFVVALGALARRADPVTGGATGALFLVLVVRCFSEPPLQSVPYSTSFLLVALTVGWSLVAADDG